MHIRWPIKAKTTESTASTLTKKVKGKKKKKDLTKLQSILTKTFV